jgi:hypothetical protein
MKSLDYVCSVISKEMDLPLDLVTKINKEYWREVKRKMNDLESTSIHVKKLGTFSVSKYMINKKIKKTILVIRGTKKSKRYSELKRIEILKSLYIRLNKLLYQRNEIAKLYYVRSKRVYETNTESI